jgi:hypothetical protein
MPFIGPTLDLDHAVGDGGHQPPVDDQVLPVDVGGVVGGHPEPPRGTAATAAALASAETFASYDGVSM